jgi:hypothetical protein
VENIACDYLAGCSFPGSQGGKISHSLPLLQDTITGVKTFRNQRLGLESILDFGADERHSR